ncbi:MAG: ribonuclease [Bacteroidetes bacterium]|nr:ribonuclease [Bacteroidota bacterium]
MMLYWHVFTNSFKLFKNHDTLTLGAALSYYTGFSLVPILIIVVSVTGSIFGPEAVQGEIKRQLMHIMAAGPAQQMEDIIKGAYQPGHNKIATIIAVVLLVIGSTSVFIQLRTSLNAIWCVKDVAKKPILKFFIDRLFSFAMIACLIFLLLTSLSIHAGLAAFANYLNRHNPNISTTVLEITDIITTYLLTSILFAIVYKYMSDAKLKWSSVWPGAFFTAVLFALGKFLIGLYLSTGYIVNTYGAAASVVLIYTWVFYSSQVFFFGAEFTHALSREKGKLLDPVRIDKKSDKGIEPLKEKAA